MNKLLALDQCIIQTLARVKFATRDQLAYFCKAKPITVFTRLVVLEGGGLISADKHHRPNIWTIKRLAAKIMHQPMPAGRRRASWSVMSHACHVNEVEILLDRSKDSKGFRIISDRRILWGRGLNPGHGEHGGIDEAKTAYLVLIDDYSMPPERIAHSWEREHHPPRKFFSGNRALSWSKIVNRFIVATTDDLRAEQHAIWIERHKIPASVITIKPLWR